MKPRVFSYSFRVWLTGILLGPILMILSVNLIFWIRATFYTRSSFGGQRVSWPSPAEVAEFYFYGLLAMIPSFFLLWAGCNFICRRSWPVRVRKLAASGWALLLMLVTAIPLGMILRAPWQAMSFLGGSYFLPLLCGICFYRFPEREDDPVFDF